MAGTPNGLETGAVLGGLAGGAAGFADPYACFVAGTRVVVGVEDGDGRDLLAAGGGTWASAEDGSSAVAAPVRAVYKTVAIEDLVARGGGENGPGGGQRVVSRDQHDPDGPLGLHRISRTFRRTAYRLRALTLRDADGAEQTLRVTEEHQFHLSLGGWTKVRELEPGQFVTGGTDRLEVVTNDAEEHPDGATVYNLEVSGPSDGTAHAFSSRGSVNSSFQFSGTTPQWGRTSSRPSSAGRPPWPPWACWPTRSGSGRRTGRGPGGRGTHTAVRSWARAGGPTSSGRSWARPGTGRRRT